MPASRSWSRSSVALLDARQTSDLGTDVEKSLSRPALVDALTQRHAIELR